MKRRSILFFLVLMLSALVGCRGETGAPAATATPSAESSEPTAEPTATVPAPTPTTAADLVILLAPDGAPEEIASLMEARISALAAERGLRWQVRQTMGAAEIAAEADFVVALPPQPDFNALVAAAPNTHFLAIGIPGAAPAANLILVRSLEGSQAVEAFLGGYIAAVLTPDWRIGIITTEDDSTADRFTAFENGMRFFCGLCRPQYAPFYEYPFLLSLPATASAAEWRALADFMRDRFVGTVYVSPGTGGPDLVQALAGYEIGIVGGEIPPAGFEDSWVASLRSDPAAAYLDYLPRLLDGETALDVTLPLLLADVNPDRLSPGRQRLVEETLADLLAGYIQPLDPATP